MKIFSIVNKWLKSDLTLTWSGRLGGGNAAGAGLGAGPLLVDGGQGLNGLPLKPIAAAGTPEVGKLLLSTGFLGTTAAEVDAVVVDPPSDACVHNTLVFI